MVDTRKPRATYLNDEEKKIIETAAKLKGISGATFLRICALSEARKVINYFGIKEVIEVDNEPFR